MTGETNVKADSELNLLAAASPVGIPQYGGLYRVRIDGAAVADFVPGPVWSVTFRMMEAEFGADRFSYEWVPVPQ